jgi:pimeloyl-ACP methyl ester carboxylesterase
METMLKIGDVDLEIFRFGTGPKLLLLESEEQLERDSPLVSELARSFEVIIPSPPGFGRSNRPEWVDNMDDISYLYLDMMRRLDMRDTTVLGFSLGGWIALELASKNCSLLKKTVLVSPYGVKHSGPTERDIADIWLLSIPEVARRKWRDPEKGKRDFPSMPEEYLRIVARNNESFARFCWSPYMHNPKLKKRLHNIHVPVHFIWGEHDGIVDIDYGKEYAAAISGATFASVPDAGHLPHIEQPQAFMKELAKYL